MFAPVYLDHNATTPPIRRCSRRCCPTFSQQFGNASSRHEYGRAARRAIDEARSQVAAAVGAHATEVVFTSGGSEANNLLSQGRAACLKAGPAGGQRDRASVRDQAGRAAWHGAAGHSRNCRRRRRTDRRELTRR
jgi:hypothetical protein